MNGGCKFAAQLELELRPGGTRRSMYLDTRIIANASRSSDTKYSAEVWACLDECRDHYGEITPSSLERYGMSTQDARLAYELHLEVGAHPVGREERSFWRTCPYWERPYATAAVRAV